MYKGFLRPLFLACEVSPDADIEDAIADALAMHTISTHEIRFVYDRVTIRVGKASTATSILAKYREALETGSREMVGP